MRYHGHLLACLWWFVCAGFTLLNVGPSLAYNIHISDTIEIGEMIFNATVADNWKYTFFDKMSSSVGKYLLQLSANSGELRLSRNIDCSNQLASFQNPFTVYIEATNEKTASKINDYTGRPIASQPTVYSLVPVTVNVHGETCHWRGNRRRTLLLEQDLDSWPLIEHTLVVNYPPGNCWSPGSAIVPLYDFLPASFRDCNDLLYSVLDHYGTHIGMILDPLTGELKAWPTQQLCLDASKHMELHYSLGLHASTQCSAARDYSMFLIPIQLTISSPSTNPTKLHNHIHFKDGKRSRRRRLRRSTRNQSPTFLRDSYTGTVFENEEPGYIIDTITASDPDSGAAGEITYTMTAYEDERSNSKFTIGTHDGIIRTLETLDREFISEHKFQIIATDNGVPPTTGMAILTINVLDRNDHSPMFELQEYYVQIDEGLNPGTTVKSIHATDDDDGSNAEITYEILNHNSPNDVFVIQNTGTVTKKKKVPTATLR